MFKHYPSLLITKLYLPRSRSEHIARADLLRTLDTGLNRKLILIAAAAGSGKTTLLADWCARHPGQAGWLSLDTADNDPARLLSYLIAAVQTCYPHIGQELLAALQSPQPPPLDTVLPALINALATLPDRLILVLDDYHVIDHPAIHSALTFLLDHLPPDITLVLLTRTDPPLPLARFRARQHLLELRAADLRFTLTETTAYLTRALSVDLPSEAVAALDTHTEGWIAGLTLASLAMKSLSNDPSAPASVTRFIQDFTGSHRFILDYLIEEVLNHHQDQVRQFLLQTAILNRFNGSLCAAVTKNPDGQSMLGYLEQHNLFLVPLDQSRTW
ncbi:MAG TPA: hypothetical protein VHL11_12195, partial [Phototrophicaceae bacterium]|nr:hypothetical protein [Phototrophicaceae bacterium]